MFQVSRRADYATRIMITLGSRAAGASMTAQEICRKTDVPKPFLHKITADLIRAGLMNSQAGPAGGLSLAKPGEAITIKQIIEAVEGPICVNVCLTRPQECPRDRFCPAHGFWGRLQQSLVAQLESVTVADLVVELRQLSKQSRQDAIPYLFPTQSVQVRA